MCVHDMCIHATITIKEEITNFGDGDTRGVGRIGRSNSGGVFMYKTLK